MLEAIWKTKRCNTCGGKKDKETKTLTLYGKQHQFLEEMTKTFDVKSTDVSGRLRADPPALAHTLVTHALDAPHARACLCSKPFPLPLSHKSGPLCVLPPNPRTAHAPSKNICQRVPVCVCAEQKAMRCLLEYCQTDGDTNLIFSVKRCKNC